MKKVTHTPLIGQPAIGCTNMGTGCNSLDQAAFSPSRHLAIKSVFRMRWLPFMGQLAPELGLPCLFGNFRSCPTSGRPATRRSGKRLKKGVWTELKHCDKIEFVDMTRLKAKCSQRRGSPEAGEKERDSTLVSPRAEK